MDTNLRKHFINIENEDDKKIYISHDKAYTRKQNKKHEKHKYKLAKELNIISNNQKLRDKKCLVKNGWACSCFLCKPTKKTNTPNYKKRKELLKVNEALKDYNTEEDNERLSFKETYLDEISIITRKDDRFFNGLLIISNDITGCFQLNNDYYYYEIDKEDNTKILGPFIYNDLVYFLAKKYDKEKYYQEYKNNNTYFTFTSIDEIMKGR